MFLDTSILQKESRKPQMNSDEHRYKNDGGRDLPAPYNRPHTKSTRAHKSMVVKRCVLCPLGMNSWPRPIEHGAGRISSFFRFVIICGFLLTECHYRFRAQSFCAPR